MYAIRSYYAVSSVKMDNIPMKPSNSIDGLLQGQSAGVQVISSSDDPGAGSTIRIRGGSSYRAGNEPLVVVDGFPIVITSYSIHYTKLYD